MIENINTPTEESTPTKGLNRSRRSLSISTKIVTGFALPILLMIFVSTVVYRSTLSLVDTASWVRHTQEVISKGYLLQKLIIDMESGERGFLITGKDIFLEPFIAAEKQWDIEILKLKTLVKDNPQQVSNVDAINLKAKTWLEQAAAPEISQRRKVKSDDISLDHIETMLQKKTGKNILDQIRQAISELDKSFVVAKNQQGSNLLVSILRDIVDQETGERGFLITGEEQFLKPYLLGRDNFNKHVSQLKSFVLNSPDTEEVQNLIEKVKSLANSWLVKAANPEIAIRRQAMGAESAEAEAEAEAEARFYQLSSLLSKGTGKTILDELRVTFSRLNTIYVNSQNESAQLLVLSLAKSLIDQETGQRGFLITGEESFLNPFNTGKIEFNKSISVLESVSNNAYDKAIVLDKIEHVESLLNEWQTKAAKVEIDTRREINKSGLSTMEFLQKIVSAGIENEQIFQNKMILKTAKNKFEESGNEQGVILVINLINAIAEQETSFLHYMVSGETVQKDQFDLDKEEVLDQLIELSVYTNSSYQPNDRKNMKLEIDNLRDGVFKWYRSDIEPALYARENIEKTRSSAIVEIQNVLKKGIGKSILDETRNITASIHADFIKAKHKKASNLVLQIEKNLVDQETGQRGYIITGEESFLEPYHNGYINLRRSISALINIANQAFDVKNTLIQIDLIESEILKWEKEAAEPEISIRKEVNIGKNKFSNIKTVVARGLGKGVLDNIRYLQSELIQTFILAENKKAQLLLLAISKNIADMETGQRGYLITGRNEFLQPYNRGKENVVIHFEKLRSIVNSSYNTKAMLTKINQLRELSNRWRELAGEPEILLRRKLNETGSSMNDVTRLIESEVGKNIIDSIREDIRNFIGIEESLISQRSKAADAAVSATLFQTIFGTVVAIIIAFIAAGYLLRTILNSLKHLAEATKRVAAGNFSVSIDIESNDQIGQLAISFNKMTKQLETTRDAMHDSQKYLKRQASTLETQKNEIETTNLGLIEAQQELQSYAEELRRSSDYKSDFMATMSHEIRTPMNGVLGMLGLLLRSDLSKNQLKKANMAHTSAQSLLTIINDILDFSKIDSGNMELDVLDFDLRNLLGEFAETMAVKAQEKGLEIILDIIEIEESMVKGDPTRISQILTNLVGNAIKFTRTGEICITAGLEPGEHDQLTLRCSIIDTGIGIPESQQENMFIAFRQIDASTTREYGGTGLGLSIVKNLCELMNGNVEVSSHVGGGSCFDFTINLQASPMAKKVIPQIDMKALNLLIVDDNTSNRNVICRQLEHWGATAFTVNDGAATLKLLKDRNKNAIPLFDMIFIDADLPGMNGEQLGYAITSDSRFNRIKLVMMTSMASNKNTQHYLDTGFSAHFPKPATTSDLFDSLLITAEEKPVTNRMALLSQPPAPVLTTPETTEQCWPGNTRILLVEDNHVNQEVVISMLEVLGLIPDVASEGKAAIKELITSQNDQPYTLIIMDCQMPGMDGYTATKNIRMGAAAKRYKDIPIIALTANAMKGDKEKCLDAGMNDYLSKPLECNSLEAMLKKWLESDNEEKKFQA